MSRNNFILASIIVIAVFLRLWHLGSVPISPDWDEVSLGYNAYSILETGRDEYGNFMPIMLKSFGDYKPALYAYVAIPSVKLFGLNIFALRLPSAVFGVFSVLLTFLLVKELFKNDKLALVSAFMMAISPWSIQFSRAAFEANLGLLLNLLAAIFFIKGLKKSYLLIFSSLFSALSIYSYQSEKIFAPLFMLVLITIYRKELFTLARKYILLFFSVGILIALPIIFATITNPQSLNRARSASFISDNNLFHNTTRIEIDQGSNDYIGLVLDNRRVVYMKQILGSYLSHFDPNWLFINGDLPRHHAPSMGLLYLWEFPFLLTGIYFLIFDNRVRGKTKLLIFSWFLLAPIPASITNDVPHAVRTLNFLPTFQIFVAVGLVYFYLNLTQKIKQRIVRNGIMAAVVLLIVFNFIYYLNQYFVQQNYFYSKDWQYGYKQAIDYVSKEKEKYNKVVVSDEVPLDQSYMFFLFYLKYPPQKYQVISNGVNNHNFDIFEFRKINWDKDRNSKQTLFVGNSTDFKDGADALKTIKYLNGEDAIKIVKSLSSTF